MHTRGLKTLAGAVVLVALASGAARAQSITISPMVGVYSQANSLDQLKDNANTLSIKRESALALGGNVELGFLRATVNYVSGATIKQKSSSSGVSTTGDIGKGKILMGAADAVIRPIPRIVVFQPYALAGIGFKNFDYSLSGTSLNDVKHSTAAFHAGLGADLMFAGVGIAAEVTDYISQGQEDVNGKKQLQHDAFGMIGLKLRLF